MSKWISPVLALFFLASSCASVPKTQERALAAEESLAWNRYGGLETITVDGALLVVRADPAVTPLQLLNPPVTRGPMGRVAIRQGLSFAINAAMFAKDYSTSIGYMKNFDLVNNPRVGTKLLGFLLFHPKSPESPAIKIGKAEELDAYHSAFQTHRVWDPVEGILWTKGASIYRQVALVAVDAKNRVLFFYHPASIDVHDLTAKILGLGLDLKGILYLDGGFHGAVYLDSKLGKGWNTWMPLPNLLGIRSPKE